MDGGRSASDREYQVFAEYGIVIHSEVRMDMHDRKPSVITLSLTILWVIGFLGSLFPSISRADECLDFRQNIRWVGGDVPSSLYETWSNDMAVDGHWAYLAHTTGIVQFDISNPGSLSWFYGDETVVANALDASSNRLCASTDGRLVVYTTGDHLILNGYVALNSPGPLQISGSYAYVANGSSGLAIVRVGGLGPPTLVGTVIGMGDVHNVTVTNDRAYVLSGSGILVVDITNPAAPRISGSSSFHSGGQLIDLTLDGRYLYVTEDVYGVRVFDLIDPDTPVLVGGLQIPNPGDIAASGERAIAAGGAGKATLYQIDISDPVRPTMAGIFREPGGIEGLRLEGSLAFAASRFGLQVFDFTSQTNPQEIGTVSSAANGSRLAWLGDDVAVLTPSELQVYDVTDPLAPIEAGTYVVPNATAMDVLGARAYVLDGHTLFVIDATDPEQPRLVGSTPIMNGGNLVAVAGNRAFVAEQGLSTVAIYDVAEPSNIVHLGDVNSCGFEGIDAQDPWTLYTVSSFEGSYELDKWDVSNPSNPVLNASMPVDELCGGVLCAGDHVFTLGLTVAEGDATTLWCESAVGRHWFGTIGTQTGSRLYTVGGNAFHAFTLESDSLAYLGSGFTPSPVTGGILEVDGYLYVTDETGMRIYARECIGAGTDNTAGFPELRMEVLRPNPFMNSVRIDYRLPEREAAELAIYDVDGRLVRSLAADPMSHDAGNHRVSWDGSDANGHAVPAGVYFVRLSTPQSVVTRRVLRLR